MTTSPDLRGLSDKELAARCKRNRAEEWLHQSGCVGGLLAGIAAAMTVVALQATAVVSWGWCFTAYLGFVAYFFTGISIFGLFEGLSRFRCRRYLRELEGRYGLLPLKDYFKAMRPGVAPGETLFVFTGQGLPCGHHWWVCVHLVGGGEAGSVEVRRVSPDELGGRPDFGRGVSPKNTLRTARADLSREAGRRLAEAAKGLRRSRIKVRSTIIDGFLVSCAVISGTAKRVAIISCNLAGVPADEASEPHIRLLQEVIAAGRALSDRPSVYGSTDFLTGEIRIDDL